jgi:hypothetical protein
MSSVSNGKGETGAASPPKETASEVKITAAKARFKTTEPILIIFSGMRSNENDWLTLGSLPRDRFVLHFCPYACFCKGF